VVPSTALQNAVALLTVAMHADETDELARLIEQFHGEDDSDELMLAVVALCRSLCFATSKLIHVIDDTLTDDEANALTDDELFPVALGVVRSYAGAAARAAEPSESPDRSERR
jgi:hypothetical protein